MMEKKHNFLVFVLLKLREINFLTNPNNIYYKLSF